jgi:Phosphotransferase enzyme family
VGREDLARALTDPIARSVSEIASLIGERVHVLHGPFFAEDASALSGRDIDCVVDEIDPMWPLRLRDGWRLGQALHYDLRGWYWVISSDSKRLALDTIDDPLGLGRDGIRTREFLDRADVGQSALRAAYLAVKRVRKGDRRRDEWGRIAALAGEDVDAFPAALECVAGTRVARLLASHALAGTPPQSELIRRLNMIRVVRRFSSPVRVAKALACGVYRYAWRVRYPTGLLVVIAGPDGTGKSTLAARLPELSAGLFKRYRHEHWRPGLLPRPGALLRRPPSDPSTPHAREPFGPAMSTLLVGYYWLDFVLGGWLLDWPVRFRTGLIVRERGWLDVAVDPGRYRLRPSNKLVRILAHALKRPDVLLVLEADPSSVAARKAELSAREVSELGARWKRLPVWSKQMVHVDASRPFEEVARAASEHILAFLEARSIARLGAGWVTVPAASTRWWLPRGPRSVARAGLGVYQPVTWKARAGWSAANTVARLGGFRLLRRGAAPPKEVRDLLAPHLSLGSTLAVSRANAPGRYVASIIDRCGVTTAIAKVATEPPGVRAIASDAAAIGSIGDLLSPPLFAPDVLFEGPGLLVLRAVPWRPRERPWELDEEVAYALGRLFAAGARDTASAPRGPAHGDCAPWNLLRTEDGWVLVDWESAVEEAPPFFDICHWMVQSHCLLGRPSQQELLDGLRTGRGWVGRAIEAYGQGSALAASPWSGFRAYLDIVRLSPETNRHESRALERRRSLLDLFEAG